MTLPVYAAPQHRHLCGRAAVALLRGREEGYPAAIRANKITPADAERGLRLARCIVDQWRWITDHARPPCPAWDENTDLFGAYSFEMEAELVRAAERQRMIAKRKPADEGAAQLADLYEALAWLQRTRHGVAWIVLRVDVERSAGAVHEARAAA
ncbi:hypothetical protein SAQ01S_18150 [Sphingomonas aquatilis NBRC 16722]|uniref:Uncharacterized protein n=1 Tax=Sphingomonas aquatilis TaxID=93063 RepID=A0AAW3TQG0_9SPHN|nr:hypothetical protein [Sphingomonas aquatilis]MBB3875281.1 hypothetical protein [Sphingomonas aquatilis]GEM72049.1 hypothetical protein SAQ01S_18150 [Sphingomonas aquatilis NBRC 16722]